MRKVISGKNQDPCAWSDCPEKAVGRSKYCRRHRAEAKTRWLAMIREKAEERRQQLQPRQLEGGGTLYPSTYLRFCSKILAAHAALKGVTWSIVIQKNGAVSLRVEGIDATGNIVTESEAL